MRNRLYLCLSVAFIVCLGLFIKTDASFIYVPAELWPQEHSKMDQGGLEASKPRIGSIPADDSVFRGDRNVTPGGQVVRETWTPTKPRDYYYLKIGLTATGYGEVAFTLDGRTKDYTIGHWTSEPLQKADNYPYTYEKKYLTNIINEARKGYVDEISTATVSISNKTGSAQTRSRQVVTYGSKQAAVSAQASATGPSVSFVIGKSTYWKWEAGITRSVNADTYNGSYTVTVNDTNIDPGSSSSGGSTPPTGSTPPSNLDIQYACGDHNGPSSGSSGHTAASCGTSGHYICDGADHSLQASCSSTDSNGNSCTVTSFYACDSHTHSYPPTTVECGHSNCSEMVSSRTSHRATCGSGSHTYWPGCPNNTSGWDQDSAHALKTCGRSACRQTWRSCQSSTPTCLANSRKKCSAR